MKVKLGDLIKPAKVIKCNNGSYPVLSMTMHSGIILQNDRFKKNLASVDQSNYKVVYKGQLVIGFPIDEGVLYIQNVVKKGIMSPAYNIWDINYNIINDKYLELCLHSPQAMQYYRANLRGTTARRRSIPTETLLKLPINLPPLDEQRHIAAVLDKVSDLIALRKKQLAKLDELVKARFVEMFGINTRQVPLTDYVWFQEGPGVRSVDFVDKGTILLTGSNINNNTISFGHKSDRFIAYELSSGKYAHFMCDKDDILVVSSAIDPDKFDKKVVVVDCNKKYCLNTGIIRFKLSKGHLTTGYFREFLKSDYFKYQVNGEMRGIAQMHFGPSHLKRMNILLPESIEIQDSFELFVQQTDKIKLLFQQGLEKLETLKKSLMQEYFG